MRLIYTSAGVCFSGFRGRLVSSIGWQSVAALVDNCVDDNGISKGKRSMVVVALKNLRLDFLQHFIGLLLSLS